MELFWSTEAIGLDFRSIWWVGKYFCNQKSWSQHLSNPHKSIGQLLEIANEIYGLDLKVRILDAENDIKGGTAGPIDLASGLKSVVVKYRLDFDNTEYVIIFFLEKCRN